MRSIRLTSALLAAAMALGAAPALAGDQLRDRIYADSFGNLVVHSRSGYKRIVVGAGHLAAELNQYERSGQEGENGEPRVVYLDPKETGTVKAERCWRPPVLLKGRSYMYGLDDGELPMPAGRCP